MGDYLINGLSLNVSINTLQLNNFSFSKTCLKAFSLCFAVNTSIKNIDLVYGFPEESAAIFFHSMKYSKSIQKLTLVNMKFGTEGFKQLGCFIGSSKTIKEFLIEDAENLGGTSSDPLDQCDNLARIMNGIAENSSLNKVSIKLNGIFNIQ